MSIRISRIGREAGAFIAGTAIILSYVWYLLLVLLSRGFFKLV